MSAAAIARSAYEQALTAAQAEEDRRRAEEAERERLKREEHLKDFEAALVPLREWFPGVSWTWQAMGDYGDDTIIWDASEGWPPSFNLRAKRFLIDMNEPEAGYRVELYVGDYVPDTSMPGYSYFSGSRVKSAADVGRYLKSAGN